MEKKRHPIVFIVLLLLAVAFIAPIVILAINSFKGKLFINTQPFALPSINKGTFAGWSNYINGIDKTGFFNSFGYSLFITVGSTILILLATSMTAWYIVRINSRFTKVLYYLLVFSMVVPFQMVMFPMSKISNMLHLGTPMGILLIYLGFGSGLSTFMFTGFVKSIPLEVEEQAMIDGCGPIRTFFSIVIHLLKPIIITVGILNVMWIWNDYLLPSLVLDTKYKTIPMAVQYLKGGYGSVDMGAMMAVLVLAIIPVVIFYLLCQKYIVKGVAAGAVKG